MDSDGADWPASGSLRKHRSFSLFFRAARLLKHVNFGPPPPLLCPQSQKKTVPFGLACCWWCGRVGLPLS